MKLLAAFPDVLRVEKNKLDIDSIWEKLQVVIDKAIAELLVQRRDEGKTGGRYKDSPADNRGKGRADKETGAVYRRLQ